MGLVVSFPTGHSTGGVLATGAGEGDAGTLAAWDEDGVGVEFTKICPVTGYLDLAISSAGQVKDPNGRCSYQ